MCLIFGHVFFGDAEGFAHAYNLVCGQRAGTHAALMTTTVRLCFQTNARFAAHVQCTHALGSINFMCGKRHQINLHARQVNVHLTGTLCSIHMKNNASGTGQFANGGNILNHSQLVVDMHDGNQNGVVTHGRFQLVQINQSCGLRIEIGDFVPFTFQLATGIQHGFMLDFAGNNVFAFFSVFSTIKMRNALDGEIIRFSGT